MRQSPFEFRFPRGSPPFVRRETSRRCKFGVHSPCEFSNGPEFVVEFDQLVLITPVELSTPRSRRVDRFHFCRRENREEKKNSNSVAY